jgi:hypothetical protein
MHSLYIYIYQFNISYESIAYIEEEEKKSSIEIEYHMLLKFFFHSFISQENGVEFAVNLLMLHKIDLKLIKN